ncbi:uncharacterized protein BO97DRAFT_390301 [Aspergillus homomorphus CBS 101889]|uniref:Integral membrane protein n=1 Tax=Aspergillus homomorphus (strain CBS 101889) TaxID=1450537 RepID=A0A395HXP6_ASPHC|nr:hypothetical protein BO97DRAFT_390301 [Aspergillus homomorphus CBS 101889]RAL12577.1 hypothetical protein BO97DRAFT_390301 [Aspergillus homomorphus CBS 101889]
MASLDPPLPPPKLLRESTDLTFSSTFTSSSSRSFSYTPNAVTFTRTRSRLPFSNKYTYRILHQPLFRNSLLAGVGYLELANAADFAANVWNEIPVPLHAKILMAIGGPCALCMTLVAARDMYLSAANVRLLRQERAFLTDSISTGSSGSHGHNTPTITPGNQQSPSEKTAIDKLNEYKHGVNTREVLTEVIDRILMDLLMGIGALLVGIGTLLAIWGADPTIYRTSNLLSGYVGNGLAAAFGVVNAVWSAYLVWRFQRCWTACSPPEDGHGLKLELPSSLKIKLRARFRALRFHALVNGINGLVAGAASMVTATMWYGYVVLVPCIASLIFLNLFWRARLGYDRSLGTFSTGLDWGLTTASALSQTNAEETGASPEDTQSPPQPSPSSPPSPDAITHHKEAVNTEDQNDDAISILLTELAYVSEMHRALLHTTSSTTQNTNTKDNNHATHILRTLNLPTTTATPTTLLTFITHHNLWESFCVWLIESQRQRQSPSITQRQELDTILGLGSTSPSTSSAVNPPEVAAATEVTLHPDDLLSRCRDQPLLVRKMKAFLVGNVTRCFAYRERYLLEMVGYAIWKESIPPSAS